MNHLGKISYGLHIIHNFAVSICASLLLLFRNPAWLVKLYDIPVLQMTLILQPVLFSTRLSQPVAGIKLRP